MADDIFSVPPVPPTYGSGAPGAPGAEGPELSGYIDAMYALFKDGSFFSGTLSAADEKLAAGLFSVLVTQTNFLADLKAGAQGGSFLDQNLLNALNQTSATYPKSILQLCQVNPPTDPQGFIDELSQSGGVLSCINSYHASDVNYISPLSFADQEMIKNAFSSIEDSLSYINQCLSQNPPNFTGAQQYAKVFGEYILQLNSVTSGYPNDGFCCLIHTLLDGYYGDNQKSFLDLGTEFVNGDFSQLSAGGAFYSLYQDNVLGDLQNFFTYCEKWGFPGDSSLQ